MVKLSSGLAKSSSSAVYSRKCGKLKSVQIETSADSFQSLKMLLKIVFTLFFCALPMGAYSMQIDYSDYVSLIKRLDQLR